MPRAWLAGLIGAAGVALGVAAEAVSFDGLGPAVADAATGWTLLMCGLWGLPQWPRDPRWGLLAASGLAWFAGNFGDAGVGAAAPIAAALVYLHRGPLVHAVALSGLRSPLAPVAVVCGYADAVAIADGGMTATVAALLAAGVGLSVRARAHGSSRPTGMDLGAGLLLCLGLGLAGAVALSGTPADAARRTDYAYEAALCGTAILLAAGAAREARTRAAVADLVVELGPGRRSSAARDALASALGDPRIEIGYWLPDAGIYVDDRGRELSLPAAGSPRRVTMLERDGERIAALVHDGSALGDPLLADAVREAAALVLSNARLQAAADHQLDEVRASRRRLVAARDAERRRLERRLHDGAQRHLRAVAEAVRDVRATGAPGGDGELLDLVEDELGQARHELVELARGIHPRALSEHGLGPALAALGERASVPVEVTVPPGRLPAAVETAAYFICSEALANVAKYARASRARCEVTRANGRVTVVVSDDGIGGADPGRGSGLRGLADRVAALGGDLRVDSAPAGGTTVRAELPLDAAAVQGEP